MLFAKYTIAAGLVALTVAATAVTLPAEADAHSMLLTGLVAGAAGAVIGSALSHPAYRAPAVPVIVHPYAPRCVIQQRTGEWGHVHSVEVCR